MDSTRARGDAKARYFGLTAEEIAKIGQDAAREARADSLARGLPVTGERDGQRIREYPDGRIEILGPVR